MLHLHPPPRRVPLSLAAVTVLGGVVGQLGWCFAAFGSLFGWIFVANADLGGWRFRGAPSVQGEAASCAPTSASVNDAPVMKITYHYLTPTGGRWTGTAYADDWCPKAGEAVWVEYLEGSPQVSRLSGARRALFPWPVAFVLLFPGIGFGMAAWGLRRGRRDLSLLRGGRLARAKVVAKEETRVEINERPVYKVRLAFTDESGREWTATVKTHTPERLEDDPAENLLYDPERPKRAVALDVLPGSVEDDGAGGLRPAPWSALALRAAAPAATAAVNAAGLWFARLP